MFVTASNIMTENHEQSVYHNYRIAEWSEQLLKMMFIEISIAWVNFPSTILG